MTYPAHVADGLLGHTKRTTDNPVFSDQPFKLGVFSLNCSGGMIMSDADIRSAPTTSGKFSMSSAVQPDGARTQAYQRIRSDIAAGALVPGSWVREGPLADTLGVSRTPVREALNALAAEGLVEIVRHRGARVSSWTRRDVDEVYSLRALLEGEAARLAAERADASVVATLREHDRAFAAAAADLSRLAAGGKDTAPALHRAVEANGALHAAVMAAADSPRLASLLASVSSTPLVALAFGHYADADLARSVAGHHDLVLGVEHHDAALAESAMRSHILGARHAAARSATDA